MKLYRFKFIIPAFLLSLAVIFIPSARAMEPGTLLFRTSGQGKMYGYSSQDLLAEKFGIINHIYPGHAAIYIGQEDGVDYIVEALSTGIVKTPAKYFINEAEGEELVAAKLPVAATPWQRARAVALAKYLASADLAYDFDFSAQKGPWSGDWTCVGLTEKVYESANANNPERLGALEYNPSYYAVDITPDGYDKDSLYNDEGDCFSTRREFSKIARRKSTILPAPEIIGYNAGKEYGVERYIFLPYTQASQSSLKDVPVDIKISSSFPDEAVRGKVNNVGLILKWSLINNPVSSVKKIASAVGKGLSSLLNGKDESSALVWDDAAGSKEIDNAGSSPEKEKSVSGPLSVVSNPNMADNQIGTKTETKPVRGQEDEEKTAPAQQSVADDVFGALRLSAASDSAENSEPKKETMGSDVKISNATATSASSKKTNVALWSPVVHNLNKTASSSATGTPALSNNNGDKEAEPEEDKPLTLLISRLHTEGNDDWLEIWNYGDQDIDLAAQKIRLEKSRTALDPGIILRFDAAADGEFPGGTIIRAGAPYRIVRDDAAPDLKAAASAIALRPDFTLMDDGYTIYLASGAVSSPDDADIIDILAYGEAKYFDGSGPAPALSSGYLLRRKALATTVLADILNIGEQANWPPIYDNDDNAHDFLLWPLGGVMPNAEEEEGEDDNQNDNEEEGNGGNESENGNNDNQEEGGDSSNQPFTLQAGIDSPGLQYLWSFSECEGSSTADMISHHSSSALNGGGQWMIGRWGCGRRISYNGAENFQADLSPALSGSNFSFAFQYKGDGEYGHPYFVFSNTEDNVGLRFEIFATMFSFTGFPGLDGRYDANGYMDNKWHQGVLVWNAAGGYWALYIDGQEMFFQNFSGLAPDFDNLQIGAYAGVVIIDDIALWNRALSPEEVMAVTNANQPFNPQIGRQAPPSVNLLHSWQFDEASGNIAHDSVGNLNWDLPEGALVYNGLSGKALSFPPIGKAYNLEVPAININNFSASWWWQNNAVLPYSGRLHLDFNQGEEKLASLALDNWQQRLWTEREEEFFTEGHEVLPEDNLWHHLALVYDDYRYLWQLFVDGELKLDLERLPLPAGAKIDNLSFRSSVGDYMIDNFKLWQGSLSADKVGEEYAAEKPE
ncbi:MAG: YiiX/YebB-like N1pC/P60 family cysteine hydrolase [Patescibacteria group bacterium]|nr:YiiX/YebB-like N1pC/P60 family cysteine hydrolase [Patescibacteria group bacterium]